jgi:hypothetical protein
MPAIFMELDDEPCVVGPIFMPFMEEFGPDMFMPGIEPEDEDLPEEAAWAEAGMTAKAIGMRATENSETATRSGKCP